MSSGCGMVKCPRCSYEFVEDGKFASFFRKLFKTGVSDDAASRH
jgi:hypothetical protein